MLRFNNKVKKDIVIKNKFKYISCYGSTGSYKLPFADIVEFKYISCYGSTLLVIQKVALQN